jgi:RNA recognition motif-containing protein
LIRPIPRIAIQRRWNSDGVPKDPAAVPENHTQESADTEESRLIDAAVDAVSENLNSVGEVTERDEAAASGESSVAEQDEPAWQSEVPEERGGRYTSNRGLRRSSEPKQTVYVGNLFFDVTAEDLRRQMEKYGVVEHAKIIHDSRGLSKG